MIRAEEVITMIESLDEASPDLTKAKAEIESIKKKLSELKSRIMKEKEMGKPPEFMAKLSNEWKSLQDKIVAVWKAYDNKHGTKYAQAYA